MLFNGTAKPCKSKLILFLLFFIVLSVSSYSRTKKHRLIYNNDGTYTLSNEIHDYRPMTIEDVYEYVDCLKNTPVTTYMICSNSSMPYYKSKYDRSLGSSGKNHHYDQEKDSTLSRQLTVYDSTINRLDRMGTDIIELSLQRARQHGLEAFITMRMNDLHFTDTTMHCSRAQNGFWINHPEYYVQDHPGWHAYGALNFAHQQVRDYKLNLIREMCGKYDLDGLDLDFMRFIVYFPYEEGGRHLAKMTDFVKKVREIIDDTGKKRGKKILLSVRVLPTISSCIEKGLDVKKWVDLKLVDFITIGAHWVCDPNLPVRQFKHALANPDIPVYVSIDDGQYYPREHRSEGIYRSIAANYYAEGADGLYLFNYFFTEYFKNKIAPLKKETLVRDMVYPDFLKELGDARALAKRNKIYTLSDGIAEYGFYPNTPLPMLISPWWEEKINILLAEDIKAQKLENSFLFLRISKGANIRVYFNKKELLRADTSLIAKYARGANLLKEEEIQVYAVPAEMIHYGNNVVAVRSNEAAARILRRLEIAVGYGEVEQYGYY